MKAEQRLTPQFGLFGSGCLLQAGCIQGPAVTSLSGWSCQRPQALQPWLPPPCHRPAGKRWKWSHGTCWGHTLARDTHWRGHTPVMGTRRPPADTSPGTLLPWRARQAVASPRGHRPRPRETGERAVLYNSWVLVLYKYIIRMAKTSPTHALTRMSH